MKIIKKIGWPGLIMALFLLALFLIDAWLQTRAQSYGVPVGALLNNILNRFGMSAIMVLAMVPMVQSGCGLNFGLPLGIIAGLIGAILSLALNASVLGKLAELAAQYQVSWISADFIINHREALSFAMAIIIAIPIAAVLGWFYGRLLNRVKGDEMVIATYVGFSSVSFMCIIWLMLPPILPGVLNPENETLWNKLITMIDIKPEWNTMVWGYGGSGLRTTISVEGHWLHVLNDWLSLKVNDYLTIPSGMLIFFAIVAFIVWVFMRTKTGTAITAVGSNPEFARASGVNVDRMRTISVIFSTILGAVGIIVYEQSFGFIQLYMGPFYMALPAVAAILLGGASVNKATILNVIIGTFLFQGILSTTPPVFNGIFQYNYGQDFNMAEMSEVLRIIVSNGMILYALTRKVRA